MTATLPAQTTIGHVHLKVADLDRALGFYRDVLGFEVQQRYGLPVVTIASLDDILVLLKQNAEFAQYREAVLAYRAQYGI